MPIKVVCAVIRREDRILICKRSSKMSHPDKWEFPGGKIQKHEKEEQALFREIREELNIEVRIESKIGEFQFSYPKKEICLIAFICSIESLKIVLSEHSNYKWIDLPDHEKYDWLEADLAIIEKLIK